jgi:hypothetical protein
MTALVTYAQLTARPGFAGVAEAEAEATIEDASDLVIDYVAPLLDDATPETVPGPVRVVIIAMVRRGIGNPRGVTQESLGDYSYSQGSDSGGVATLYMTRREKKIVRKAVGQLGAGGIDMEGWLPTQPSEAHGGTVDPWSYIEDEE